MVKKVETAEDVFDFLKERDTTFKTIKEESEYPHSWSNFKKLFFSDKGRIEWLESKIDECNQKKSNNISKGQKESEVCQKNLENLIKKGTKNLKKAISDPEHQRKAGLKGQESLRRINAERLDALIKLVTDNLPKEFTDDDLLEIRNNNLENIDTHTTHKSKKPLSEASFIRKFKDNAIKLGLIVKIKRGNQHTPSVYHKINDFHSFKNKEEDTEEKTIQENKCIIKTTEYFQSSTWGNINVIYQMNRSL